MERQMRQMRGHYTYYGGDHRGVAPEIGIVSPYFGSLR